MDLSIWLSYVGTVLILTLSPGPSVLLATANSMKHGRGKTLGTILGDLSANLLQICLASLGLATIVISSGEVFQVIKWCGVAYLIYMGITKFFTKPTLQEVDKKTGKGSFSRLYMEGFLMSAANPKAIVFFAALFPLFLNQTTPLLPQIAILSLTFLTLDGLSLLLYATFAERLKSFLEDQQKMHLQNRIVGILLILSGIMLSFVQRATD